MEKKSTVTIQQVALAVIVVLVALLGLLLLPFTDNFIFDTKAYGFFFLTMVIAALFILQGNKRRSFNIVLAPFTLPLFLFGISAGASTFLTNAYPVEHLLSFGGMYLAMVVIALLGGSILPKKSVDTFLHTLGVVSGIITLCSVLELLGVGPARMYNQLFGFNLPTTLIFNLTGSSFIALQMIIISLVGMISYCVIHRRLPKFFAAIAPILLIGLAVHVWSLLPGKPAELRLPSFAASWSVALDAIRQPRAALIGVGPSSYQNVYTQFKPLWVNMTSDWNIQYSQGSNFPLSILTTLGFFGLITWIAVILQVARQLKHSDVTVKTAAMLVLLCTAIQLLVPINAVLLALFSIMLALLTAAQQDRAPVIRFQALSAQIAPPTTLEEIRSLLRKQTVVNPLMLVSAVLFVALAWLGYATSKTYFASALMFASNRAAQQNDAAKTYELQQRAVTLNPYLDSFRRRYALTNALIALALSNKADITEDEKTQVSQLLQQAIREARSATLLDQTDTQNWLILAQIYQNVIGATEDALPWTVQSYVKAIETNPTDPSTRIALGGIFLNQKQYDQAIGVFTQAVDVKSDFVNSHYNLAVALRAAGRLQEARTEYQRVLALLDADSADYTQANSELENLEREISAAGSADVAPNQDALSKPAIIDQNLENESSVISNPSNQDGAEINNEALLEPAPQSVEPSPTDTQTPSPNP